MEFSRRYHGRFERIGARSSRTRRALARRAATGDTLGGVGRPPASASTDTLFTGKRHALCYLTLLLSMIYCNVIFVSLRRVFALISPRREPTPRRAERGTCDANYLLRQQCASALCTNRCKSFITHILEMVCVAI
jgi:hypothetical protein